MVLISMLFPESETISIAPRLALMPQAMFMPSNAGPAAVDVAVSCPFTANTISPFVPMSTNNVTPRNSASFAARMPEVMSAPTYADMIGGR